MSRWLDSRDMPCWNSTLTPGMPAPLLCNPTYTAPPEEAEDVQDDRAEQRGNSRPLATPISLAFVAAIAGFALQIGQTDLLIEEIAIAQATWGELPAIAPVRP